MKIIKDISTEDVIAIDIETVRLVKDYKDLNDDWKSGWMHKNKQDGQVPTEEELAQKWMQYASLYPEFSKVCSVSLVYVKGGILRCKQYTSPHEYLLLMEMANDLAAFKKSKSQVRLIGHASKHYDYPFLCKRYIINRMDIPDALDESFAKPWEQTLMCTNELWKSFGTAMGNGTSLQALCLALDVPVSKVDLVGDEVGKAYYDGELERIANYCSLDTIATFNVLRRFKKESIFLESEVQFANKGQILQPGDVKEIKKDFFEKILFDKKISPAAEKKLREILPSLDAQERADLALLLKSCLHSNPIGKEINLIHDIEFYKGV